MNDEIDMARARALRIRVGDDGAGLVRVENVVDFVDLPAATRVITNEGYLKAPAQIARTGIQEYFASELGLDKSRGYDPNKVVRLMRPAEEVGASDTILSFDGQAMAVGHPPKGINASNWRTVAVGDFANVKMAGDYMLADVTVRDAAAVAKVQAGTSQLSCGYDFDLDLTPGTTGDGQAYDGVQRNIRGNHLSIVDRARGGLGCRIGDGKMREDDSAPAPAQPKETTMRIRMADAARQALGITIPGFSFNIEGADADRVQDAVDKTVAGITTTLVALDAAKTEATTEKKRADDAEAKVTDLTTKLTAEKKRADDAVAAQPTEAQIEALAEKRQVVVADGTLVMPKLDAKGKTISAIRTEVLDHVLTEKAGRRAELVTAILGAADEAAALAEVKKGDKADQVKVQAAFAAVVSQARATDADAGSSATSAADAATGAALLGGRSTTSTGGRAGGGKRLRGQDALRANLRGENAAAE